MLSLRMVVALIKRIVHTSQLEQSIIVIKYLARCSTQQGRNRCFHGFPSEFS